MNYETLAKHLGLEQGLTIDLIEVDRVTQSVTLVVSGNLPSRTATEFGFSPSPKNAGHAPDSVHFSYLTKE